MFVVIFRQKKSFKMTYWISKFNPIWMPTLIQNNAMIEITTAPVIGSPLCYAHLPDLWLQNPSKLGCEVIRSRLKPITCTPNWILPANEDNLFELVPYINMKLLEVVFVWEPSFFKRFDHKVNVITSLVNSIVVLSEFVHIQSIKCLHPNFTLAIKPSATTNTVPTTTSTIATTVQSPPTTTNPLATINTNCNLNELANKAKTLKSTKSVRTRSQATTYSRHIDVNGYRYVYNGYEKDREYWICIKNKNEFGVPYSKGLKYSNCKARLTYQMGTNKLIQHLSNRNPHTCQK